MCASLAERLLDAIAAVRAREGEAAASAGLLDNRPKADATRVQFEAWSQAVATEAHRLEARAASYDEQQGLAGLAERFQQLAASGRTAQPRQAPLPHLERPASGARDTPSRASGGGSVDPGPVRLTPAGKAQRIAEVLEVVDVGVSDTERGGLSALADTVLEAEDRVFSTLLTDLKVRVQQVNHAAVKRRAEAARAEALLVSLDGLEGNEVADARSLLERVKQGSSWLRVEDVAVVERVRERAMAERERRFVATRLARALGGLGYEVGAEFERELQSGRAGVALVEGSPEHAVHIEVGDGQLAYRLVRTDPGDDPEQDKRLESALCRSMGSALGELHGAGVGFRFVEHHEPGARPVEVSEGAAKERRRLERAARSAPKARERER